MMIDAARPLPKRNQCRSERCPAQSPAAGQRLGLAVSPWVVARDRGANLRGLLAANTRRHTCELLSKT
jgi:hypothetical protein